MPSEVSSPSAAQIESYWVRMRVSTTVQSAVASMTSLPNWWNLKNSEGANPVLTALGRFPELVKPGYQQALYQAKRHGLLGDIDSKGRDLWFRLLLSVKDDSGFWVNEPAEMRALLKSYPPRRDKEGCGWLAWCFQQLAVTAVSRGINLLRAMGDEKGCPVSATSPLSRF